jgi:hypothetical protein
MITHKAKTIQFLLTETVIHTVCGEVIHKEGSADNILKYDHENPTCKRCLNHIKTHTCKNCGKVCMGVMTDHEYKNFVSKYGLCKKCYVESKGLVKSGSHHVPWDYRYDAGTSKEMESEYYDDVNASLPSISWCEKYKKYKVEFSDADIGGYDVQPFVWYFDSLEDILLEMGVNLKETEA